MGPSPSTGQPGAFPGAPEQVPDVLITSEARNVQIWRVRSSSRAVSAVRICLDVRSLGGKWEGSGKWKRLTLKGVSFCHPRDRWDEHVGFRQAVNHALQEETIEVRRAVWAVAVPVLMGLVEPEPGRGKAR